MKFHNKFSKKIFLILNVLILIASSCSQAAITTEQPIPTLVSSPTAFVAETTSIPSPTKNIPSTSTTQPLPVISIEKGCFILEEQLPSDIHFTGVWIRRSSDPYLENLEEKTKYRVPLDGGGTFQYYDGYYAISPNGKWFAYLDVQLENSELKLITNGYSLKVINSSGHSLNMNYWPVSFQKLYGWVDNENLLLEINIPNRNNYGRFIILNPISGSWRYFQTSELVDGNSEISAFEESIWSANGNMLLTATDKGQVIHIYQSRNEILTLDLVENKLASPGFFDYIFFSRFNWTLNNNKLMLESFDETIILDFDKQSVYELCFDNEGVEENRFLGSFFYSSDGRYLITHVLQKETNFNYQHFDVLIDLNNGRAYKLDTPENHDRIGWLASP